MEALATKYRPRTFEEVAGQKYVIEVLKRQLSNHSISNCYLFAGPTGTGKTTLARIFANSLNEGMGSPIEIDAASNNGVDNIRAITEESKLRSLDAKYRVYIIDEVHMITKEGWNAFLKTLEEPTATTVFILCTTEPQKVPATILNRVMRFNLSKIPLDEIRDRLNFISKSEGFTNYEETCDYIAKLSQGGLRDAVSMLDKCSKYSTSLDVEYAQQLTGNVSYDTMFKITNAIVDGIEHDVIQTVDDIYNQGYDLKLFVDQYIDFLLDMEKYILFNGDINATKFPHHLEVRRGADGQCSPLCVKYVAAIQDGFKIFNTISNALVDLKFKIKYDASVRDTVTVYLVRIVQIVNGIYADKAGGK